MTRATHVFANTVQADPAVWIPRTADSLANGEFEGVPIIAHSRSDGLISAQTCEYSNPAVRHRAGESRPAPKLEELDASERTDVGLAVLSGIQGQLAEQLRNHRGQIDRSDVRGLQLGEGLVGDVRRVRSRLKSCDWQNRLRFVTPADIAIINLDIKGLQNVKQPQRLQVYANTHVLRNEQPATSSSPRGKREIHDTPQRGRWSHEVAVTQVDVDLCSPEGRVPRIGLIVAFRQLARVPEVTLWFEAHRHQPTLSWSDLGRWPT